MVECLPSAVKEDEELVERLKTCFKTINLLKLSSNDIFLSLKNKKSVLDCFGCWWCSQWFTTYKTNFMIFEMIRPHVMFFRMFWHSLSFWVLCANPTHKYPNLIFKYYFHLPQHTSARAAFQLSYKSKRKHKIEGKLKMIWHWLYRTLNYESLNWLWGCKIEKLLN